MRHMGLNAPASQRRGKSVSDGFSRTSLRVFAVTLLAVLFVYFVVPIHTGSPAPQALKRADGDEGNIFG